MQWRRGLTTVALVVVFVFLLTGIPFTGKLVTRAQVPPLVFADFNGDGSGDIAIGAPGEEDPGFTKGTGPAVNAGAVHVLYGSAAGPASTDGDLLLIDEGAAEENDSFGHALAVGDFDGDGLTDLAVGVPFENVGSVVDAGAVNVFYGAAEGVDSVQVWTQASAGETVETGDLFGHALAAGDFNGDGFTDLAVGVPGENIGSIVDAGGVNVIYGSPTGLSSLAGPGSQFWSQDSPAILDAPEVNDFMGFALAAGDFDGDTHDDLAVGVPGENIEPAIGTIADAGAVNVIYGALIGLIATFNQVWTQNSLFLDPAEAGDNFGWALAAGDFDQNGEDDLAVGVPFEDLPGFIPRLPIVNAGAVNVLRGDLGGLSAAGTQFWHQNTGTIEDSAETGDQFGYALAVGDFNGDNEDDLVVGVPFEDIGTIVNAGAVNVIYGSPTISLICMFGGLCDLDNPDQFWHQNVGTIQDVAESGDKFGFALASGFFNGGNLDDLAIGVPGENLGTIVDAGAVHVLLGSGPGLVDEGNMLFTQNSAFINDTAEANDEFGRSLAGR